MPEPQVLVVGAGPTGLVLALELVRHGIDCDIIDKLPQPSDKSKALVVHARSMEQLYDMGCLQSFLTNGLEIRSVSIHADNKQIARFTLDEADSPYPFALGIPQSATEGLLTFHLEKKGKQVKRPVELVKVEQNGAGVTATLSCDGKLETKTYRYLAACDGAHSTVRKALGEPYTGNDLEEGFMLADAVIDWGEGKEQPDPVCAFSSKDGVLAFFAMPGKYDRVIATVNAGAIKSDKPALSEIQEIVDRVCADKPVLSDPQWLTSFTIRYRQIDNYRHDRIFFSGDAAHIHSPAGGQGMNTGMQDAYNLAWKLALACKGFGGEKLLTSYHHERHEIGKELLKATEMLTKVNFMRNSLAREMRNKLAPFLSGQEIVRSRMRNFITEVGINYRHSPLVFEEKHSAVKSAVSRSGSITPSMGEWFAFSSGPQAGDHAPDAVFLDSKDDECTVYKALAGTKHVLLLLTGADADDAELNSLDEAAAHVNSRHADLINIIMVIAEPEWLGKMKWKGTTYTDPEYAMHHRYGAGSSCMYLIRPDKYIGMRAQPIDARLVDRYMDQIIAG